MVEENFFLRWAKSIKINTTKFSSHLSKNEKEKEKEKEKTKEEEKNRKEEVVSPHLKKWFKVKMHCFNLVSISPKLLLLLGQIHA